MDKTEAYLALERIARERILILDGSMGTLIQSYGLGEDAYRAGPLASHQRALKGDNDALCLGSPEIPGRVHEAYLAAGADIITTDSFTATRVGQAEYGLGERASDMALASARIARRAADEWTGRDPGKPRFVAGCLGPTGKSLSISPDPSDPSRRSIGFEELSIAYREEAEALIEGGADLLLVETAFDTLNAKAAIYALLSVFEERGRRWPIMVSGTIVDRSGRNLSGQTTEAFLASVAHAAPLSVGLNCSLGARDLQGRLEEIAAISPFLLSAHPNAGLPNASGGYDEGPEAFASAMARIAREVGLNIAGGCCGTTSAHIAALCAALDGVAPRRPPGKRRITCLSGLESLEIGPESLFVNVGERSNVAGSRKFARLAREAAQGAPGGYERAVGLALEQVEAGAQAVDVNLDDPLIDSRAAMRDFVNAASCEPALATVPFMIDSSDFDTIIAGLRCAQGKCVVNSISLKEGEGSFLAKAREIAKYGAAAVVMAFDEEGQAATLPRRLSILERAHRLLSEEAGYDDEDIIFDPNIFAVGTGLEEHRRYALDFLEATRELKARHPLCLVSGGVSNLSFAFRGDDDLRQDIHTVFLYHARAAGMGMGIVNPAALGVYDEIEAGLRGLVEDLLFDRRADAAERLLAASASRRGGDGDAPKASGAVGSPNVDESANVSIEERIVHDLVAGRADAIVADAEAAMGELGSAYAVISGPLMRGMDRVGELFGQGKMFLPQVVKSARVMRQAVSALGLSPADGKAMPSHGTIVLATVKGDVHDIGKNIVAIVLQCNGYRVVDLGVMVDCETALDAAEREKAAALGLSGLIAPSLEEMAHVAREMERRGMSIPLVVGGAATSPLHTALKIAPHYSGPVMNVRDASLAPGAFAGLLDESRREAYVRELAASQGALRAAQGARPILGARVALEADEGGRILSLSEARERSPRFDFTRYAPPEPLVKGIVESRPSISELVPYIDWRLFFHEWGIEGSYPAILDDARFGSEARRLEAEARAMLARLEAEGRLAPACLCAILPAAARGDDAVVYADESRGGELAAFSFPRQRRAGRGGKACLCLADYLAPAGSGVRDWMGLFALTAGEPKLDAEGEQGRGGLDPIAAGILAHRIAEAASEWLHERVRRSIWGYESGQAGEEPRRRPGGYRGIRPAPGYPTCPEHKDKAAILELLEAGRRIGISLTGSYMMLPAASVSGFYFSHPEAEYFAIGEIGEER